MPGRFNVTKFSNRVTKSIRTDAVSVVVEPTRNSGLLRIGPWHL